jgi:hypothetical protein
MKEVIMKKLLFWMVLIVGIVALLGSCAKKDDKTAATAATADNATSTTSSITTTTPSGSITMGSYTASGVYKSACGTSAVSYFISANAFPSDVQSYAFAFVVTGNDNVTLETHTFTDTGCTTSSYINKLIRDNVTVGTASGANYPVTYNGTGFKWTVNTTVAKAFLENLYSSISLDMTVGTEKFIESTGSLKYGLWTPGDTTIYYATESSSSTPSEAGSTVYTKE